MSIAWNDLISVSSLLDSEGIQNTYWNRDFNNKPELQFNESDDVVFILPGFSWNCAIDNLPFGVKNEVKMALSQKKCIWIAYRNSFRLEIYDSHITESPIQSANISAIACTSSFAMRKLKSPITFPLTKTQKFNSEKISSTKDFEYDSRLLFLI